MDHHGEMQSLTDLENVIFVCFGEDSEADLPQVESEEDVIINLMQARTNRARSRIERQWHDPCDDPAA